VLLVPISGCGWSGFLSLGLLEHQPGGPKANQRSWDLAAPRRIPQISEDLTRRAQSMVANAALSGEQGENSDCA
jgi:hypothetical protein